MGLFKNILNYIFLLAIIFLKGGEKEIRKITPPYLDPAFLGERIVCYRPMRRGSPKMKIKMHADKIVAHNYGHGGSGWTLGPGSTTYVNNLLLKYVPHNDSPITILGAGALGLFTAYDLVNRGFNNLTLIAAEMENLTSDNAGGLLAPVSMDNHPDMQRLIDDIGLDAYKFYERIARKQDPVLTEGAIIVPTYFKTREESGLEPYVGKVMQSAKDVIVDFGNGTTREMVCYDDGIFIDTAKMMASLKSYLQPHISFIKKEINDFSEVPTPYIINCTGLGSKTLNNDRKLVSVQGHLVMLKNQNPENLYYMMLTYFNEDRTRRGYAIKRSFYFFPKRLENAEQHDVGVIGGTFVEDATSETPHEEEFDILIDNARKFYGTN